VVSYSLPFEGEVTREELDPHLHTHRLIPEAIPFVYKYYERDWGLCCSQDLKAQLTDEKYRVRIKSDFSYSTLKVGEMVLPGETDEIVYLCAHLCHPGQVNDDLTGVAVALDVMRHLARKARRRYTYRFIIVPETIGSVAYLSQNEELIAKMKGGLFFETLAHHQAHTLQLSFQQDTEVDRCFCAALREHEPGGEIIPFDSTNMTNDERQFNAPGVGVPMLSLMRVLPKGHPDWPFREYHSSHDNPSLTSQESLEKSRDLALAMLDTLERNFVPRNLYRGEVFLSRFGLYPDWTGDLDWSHILYETMYRIDGKRSILDISQEISAPFDAVAKVVELFRSRGLVA
jgi:aminopeptidase-like protein